MRERGRRVAVARKSDDLLIPSFRQNNSRLDELASKVSALRGVTIDIYDNARNQEVIDSSVRLSNFLRLAPTERSSRTNSSRTFLLRSRAARPDLEGLHNKETSLRY